MALKYEYLKMKLPKKNDYAYPFKKSDIDNALVEAGVTNLGNLCFSTGKRTDYTEGHPVIVALFPGESRKGYWSRNSPILDIYTVPKEHLEHIRLLMTTKDILNKIMRWLVSLETASNVTRDTTRIRCVMFVDDELRVLDEGEEGSEAAMTLEYRFSGRGKLVKGYTYPIKRGDLDVALERAGVTDLEYVSYTCYSGKVEKNLIISADMIGESFHPGNWYKQSPDIGAYAVPTIISQRVKKLLIAQDVLNSLATWLKELEQAENVRRDQRQYYYVYFEDDALVIEHT